MSTEADEIQPVITEASGTCAYEGCAEPATQIACGRTPYRPDESEKGHPKPAMYCDAHANIVSEEGKPEYYVTCPNCDCAFGVN